MDPESAAMWSDFARARVARDRELRAVLVPGSAMATGGSSGACEAGWQVPFYAESIGARR
jgi:hypothetical protein